MPSQDCNKLRRSHASSVSSAKIAVMAALLLFSASAVGFALTGAPAHGELIRSTVARSVIPVMAAHPKFGDKKLVVVTGTSSGLGKSTARALIKTGQYHVVGAVRDMDKMELVAEIEEFPEDLFTAMEVELNSYASVRKFCKDLETFKAGKSLDRLICNAGVYQPSLPEAKWSEDGHEQQMQVIRTLHTIASCTTDELCFSLADRCCPFLHNFRRRSIICRIF